MVEPTKEPLVYASVRTLNEMRDVMSMLQIAVDGGCNADEVAALVRASIVYLSNTVETLLQAQHEHFASRREKG